MDGDEEAPPAPVQINELPQPPTRSRTSSVSTGNGHNRGRSVNDNSLSGRFSRATERIRSASRGKNSSPQLNRTKSPQDVSPYESVPPLWGPEALPANRGPSTITTERHPLEVKSSYMEGGMIWASSRGSYSWFSHIFLRTMPTQTYIHFWTSTRYLVYVPPFQPTIVHWYPSRPSFSDLAGVAPRRHYITEPPQTCCIVWISIWILGAFRLRHNDFPTICQYCYCFVRVDLQIHFKSYRSLCTAAAFCFSPQIQFESSQLQWMHARALHGSRLLASITAFISRWSFWADLVTIVKSSSNLYSFGLAAQSTYE